MNSLPIIDIHYSIHIFRDEFSSAYSNLINCSTVCKLWMLLNSRARASKFTSFRSSPASSNWDKIEFWDHFWMFQLDYNDFCPQNSWIFSMCVYVFCVLCVVVVLSIALSLNGPFSILFPILVFFQFGQSRCVVRMYTIRSFCICLLFSTSQFQACISHMFTNMRFSAGLPFVAQIGK